uniref:Uncharacterized protein n=1 Tax=Solibacter usitatus (strain Ellin6076) TaxID=234267 RepID=Q01SQ2_SOLUE
MQLSDRPEQRLHGLFLFVIARRLDCPHNVKYHRNLRAGYFNKCNSPGVMRFGIFQGADNRFHRLSLEIKQPRWPYSALPLTLRGLQMAEEGTGGYPEAIPDYLEAHMFPAADCLDSNSMGRIEAFRSTSDEPLQS